jgi:hypothetical protein
VTSSNVDRNTAYNARVRREIQDRGLTTYWSDDPFSSQSGGKQNRSNADCWALPEDVDQIIPQSRMIPSKFTCAPSLNLALYKIIKKDKLTFINSHSFTIK